MNGRRDAFFAASRCLLLLINGRSGEGDESLVIGLECLGEEGFEHDV